MANKKILVADDDPGIVDAVQVLLEDSGYDVITTMHGEEIIKLSEQQPALIFLDIWMSGVNGNTICIDLKNNPITKNIPVIMFSANRDVKDIAAQSGADGYLSKPFE